MIYRILIIILAISNAAFTQKDASIEVVMPLQNPISLNSFYDSEWERVYSIADASGGNKQVIDVWDLTNLIPLASIELPKHMPIWSNSKDVHFRSDDRFIWLTAYHNGWQTYRLNKQTFDLKGPMQSNVPPFANLIENSTVESANNKVGDKSYEKVSGRRELQHLSYVEDSSINILQVNDGNYITGFFYEGGDDMLKHYPSYTDIRQYDYENSFDDRDWSHFPFNTIAASCNYDGSKLALLDADFKTVRFLERSSDKHFKLIDSLQVEHLDTNAFGFSIIEMEGSELLSIISLKGVSLVSMEDRTVRSQQYDIPTDAEGNLYFNKDTVNLFSEFYNDFHLLYINDRQIGIEIGNKSRRPGRKDYTSWWYRKVQLVVDRKSKEFVYMGYETEVTESNHEEIVTFFDNDYKTFNLYDINLQKVIRKVDLDNKLDPVMLVMPVNSNRSFMTSEGGYTQHLYELFPLPKKLSSVSGGADFIVYNEEVTEVDDKAYAMTTSIADDYSHSETPYFFDPADFKLTEWQTDYPSIHQDGPDFYPSSIGRDSSNVIYGESDLPEMVKDSLLAGNDAQYAKVIRKMGSTYDEFNRTLIHAVDVQMDTDPGQAYVLYPDKVDVYDYVNDRVVSSHRLKSRLLHKDTVHDNFGYNRIIHYDLNAAEIFYFNGEFDLFATNMRTGAHRQIKSYNDLSGEDRIIERSKSGRYFFEMTVDTAMVYDLQKDEIINSFKPESQWNVYYGDSSKAYKERSVSDVFVRDNGELGIIRTNGSSSSKEITFSTFPENRQVFSVYTSDEGVLFRNAEGFYFGDAALTNGITFKQGDQVYPFDQYDFYYNRPHKVMKTIADYFAIENQEVEEILEKAYRKRLRRLGIGEVVEPTSSLPELIINNSSDIPRSAEELHLDLTLRGQSKKLKEMIVEINGVPVRKVDLSSKTEANLELDVELMENYNRLKLYCRDVSGNSSYPQYLSLYGLTEKPSDLYLITLGGSKYEQSSFNLNYAAKDANDIVDQMKGSNAFNDVKSLTITNENLTRERLGDIKSFLSKSGTNDEVMLFVAGHGVLDEEFDLYLATYDMDFTNPSERGIAYSELDGLLDGIKPIRKILMMDACHSGEIDKEEVALIAQQQTETGDIQFRSVGNSSAISTSGVDYVELNRSMFADLRAGTGSTVISSAGGMEFAMEGENWKNGLFTYCLLNGIKSMEADLDKDGEIYLSELQDYIAKEVFKLSNGMQKPTSRTENLSLDYRVW